MGNVNANAAAATANNRDRTAVNANHRRHQHQQQQLLTNSRHQTEDTPNYIERTRLDLTAEADRNAANDYVIEQRRRSSREGDCSSEEVSVGIEVKDEVVEAASNSSREEVSGKKCSTNKQLPTVFRWEGGGKEVAIGGPFSQWKTVPMARSHGDFVAIIDLPQGEHEYMFYVDGEWKHDPDLKIKETEAGTKSNVVKVKESDFEVFQALEKDIEENHPDEVTQMKKEYGQNVSTIKPWDKPVHPPSLPPHFLQIILNKDTSLSCDPTLLPEPNHVMLNHLFALSIKEGVMVLSASHRYRKKCVTTLLYKQI